MSTGDFVEDIWCAWNGHKRAVLGFSRNWSELNADNELYFVIGYTAPEYGQGKDFTGALLAVFSGRRQAEAGVALDWSADVDYPRYIEVLRLDGAKLFPVVLLEVDTSVDDKNPGALQGVVQLSLREQVTTRLVDSRIENFCLNNWQSEFPKAQAVAWIGAFPILPLSNAAAAGVFHAKVGRLDQIEPRSGEGGDIALKNDYPTSVSDRIDDADTPTISAIFRSDRIRGFCLGLTNLQFNNDFDVSGILVRHIPRIARQHWRWRQTNQLGDMTARGVLKANRDKFLYQTWVETYARKFPGISSSELNDTASFLADRYSAVLEQAEEGGTPSPELGASDIDGHHIYLDEDSGIIHITIVSVGDRIILYDKAGRRFNFNGQRAGRYIVFEVSDAGELKYLPDAYSSQDREIELFKFMGESVWHEEAQETLPDAIRTWFESMKINGDLANLSALYLAAAQAENINFSSDEGWKGYLRNAAAVATSRILFNRTDPPQDVLLANVSGSLLEKAVAVQGNPSAIEVPTELTTQLQAIVMIWRMSRDVLQKRAMRILLGLGQGMSVTNSGDNDFIVLAHALAKILKPVDASSADVESSDAQVSWLLQRNLDLGSTGRLADAIQDLKVELEFQELGFSAPSADMHSGHHSTHSLADLQKTFEDYLRELSSKLGETNRRNDAISKYQMLYSKCESKPHLLSGLVERIYALHTDILTPPTDPATTALMESLQQNGGSIAIPANLEALVANGLNQYAEVLKKLRAEVRESLIEKEGFQKADATLKQKIESISVAQKLQSIFERCDAAARKASPGSAKYAARFSRMLRLWPANYYEARELLDKISSAEAAGGSK